MVTLRAGISMAAAAGTLLLAAGCGDARAASPAAAAASRGDTATAAVARLPVGATNGQGDGEWTMPGRDYAVSR